jgi:two-component system nitrate/nitrite sensor histidine kinase NarX
MSELQGLQSVIEASQKEPGPIEGLLSQLAENVDSVLWIADADRRQVLYVNEAYERIWQESRALLYERPAAFLELVCPSAKEGPATVTLAASAGLEPRFCLARPDGSERWLRARSFPIYDAAGHLDRIAGVIQDITEQVQSYQLLEQRANERTRELSTLLAISHQMASVLEVKPLLARILDELANIVDYTSATIYRLLKASDEVQVLDYRGPLPREQVVDLRFPLAATVGLEEVVARREPVIISDTWDYSPLARAWRESPHAVQRWLVGSARSWMAVPLRVEDRLIGILRLGHQLPNRFLEAHAELALAFADHAAVAMDNARLYEQVQALAVVEERQRLARDLHDAVSQTLFSASLIADVLPRVWEQDREKGRESLGELQQLARGALGEMRSLLFELRPAALVDVEMAELLRHLVDAAAGHAGMPISLKVETHCPIPPDVQVALYRIAQEALNNIVKHARATSAAVSLRCPPSSEGEGPAAGTEIQCVELVIEDDGQGFEPQMSHAGSFGLSNIQERASSIGATLDVSSAPGQGTTVRVVWPA